MGRVNTPILSESAKLALEQGQKNGKTHTFRRRCQVILLKSTGRTSEDVALITSMTYVSVNAWVKRYKDLGIDGLQTLAGRGRKPKLTKEADKESVLKAAKAHRQRLQTAKAEWQEQSGKTVSISTLKSFLKVLTDDIKE
jgi:transposase